MAKRTVHKGALVGVLMLVVMVLVLLLVPTIAANGLSQVGNTIKDHPYICTMADQNGDPVPLDESVGEVEISRVETPNADDWYDVVALLKCRANLDNDQGYAITYSGTNPIPCLIELDSEWKLSSTASWSQTISASGNATLTCQFKRHNQN